MKQNNIKIAVTGGICSGKSTVTNFIREQGYPVISCDEIYGDLLREEQFKKMLQAEFGDILSADGSIDKRKLADIVFSDAKKRERLNGITHPRIFKEAFDKMTGEGTFFCEVPLLFESGAQQLFDGVIVVLRKKSERIAELMKRLKIDEKQALLRINSQFDYENATFVKYYAIHNSGNLDELREKTLFTLEAIKKENF